VRKLLMIVVALLLAASVQAQTADNAALEKHVMAVSEQLRCLVCQNQTIADSHADLAVDLRNQVREKIQQGMSDQDIFNFMVERYGDFVLYRPPLRSTTWLLWFGPFLLMAGGLIVLFVKLSSRAKNEEKTDQAQPILDADTDQKESS